LPKKIELLVVPPVGPRYRLRKVELDEPRSYDWFAFGIMVCVAVPPRVPVAPVYPVYPVGPVYPVYPVYPVGPVYPVYPVYPVGPTVPVYPVYPV
jgi:hypothetical protein